MVVFPYVAFPGSVIRLNLFEPRWLTLFETLTREGGGDEAAAAARLMRSADGKRIMDLDKMQDVTACVISQKKIQKENTFFFVSDMD